MLEGVDEDTIRAVIAEAGKFGAEVLEPLDSVGDRTGSKLVDGKVVTPPGWKEAYAQYVAGGWNGLGAPAEMGRPGAAAGGGDGRGRNLGLRPTSPSACARS